MQLAGWILVGRATRCRSKVDRRRKIGDAILEAWPDCVRLTLDDAGAIAIWRQPAAGCPDPRAPFPTPPDIAHALRVIEAVGMGRGVMLTDELARLNSAADSFHQAGAIAAALDADQVHFESVAEAMRTFECAAT